MYMKNQELSYNNMPLEMYDEDFIGLINKLSEAIKEHYKVSKHNIKEAKSFLLLLEKQQIESENLLNEITPIESLEKINEIFQKINQSQNLISQLLKNSNSNDMNLNFFFDNAKIIFKKMKIKRSKNLGNFRSISGKKADPDIYGSLNKEEDYELNAINKINNITSNINPMNDKKLLNYLNQLKDYNEIIGKFSSKAKFNYMSLQKLISNEIIENKNNINDIKFGNRYKNSPFEHSNYQLSINLTDINNNNKYEYKNNYEKEISILNTKIKKLEKIINENKTNYIQYKKFEHLKKKIELELSNTNITNNENKKYINFSNQNEFENMILDIIEKNKNSVLEMNNIKNDIKKKNEAIKNLKLNNNQLNHDLLDKNNIILEKENEILMLSQENERYKTKYEESNNFIKNLNSSINSQNNSNIYNSLNNNRSTIDSVIELRKEIKSLYNQNNTLRNELNNLKLNIAENEQNNDNNNTNDENLEKDKNHKEISILKKELDLQKKNYIFNKKKYEKEINSLTKKIQELSKQLTLKIQEIISLQSKIKSLMNENYNLNNFKRYNTDIKRHMSDKDNKNFKTNSQPKDVTIKNSSKTSNTSINKNMNILKEENIKLKNIINNYKKEKNESKNSLFRLDKRNKVINKENSFQNNQYNGLSSNTSYNDTILNLQKQLKELKEIIEDNNKKSLEYQRQINNLQNLLNEKDILINQYKDKNQNIKNNNINNIMNINNNDINQLQILNKNLLKEIELKKKEIETLKTITNKNQNNLIAQYKSEINALNQAILKTNSIIEEKDLIIKKLKDSPIMDNKNNIGDNNSSKIFNLKITELENHINKLESRNKTLTEELMKHNFNQVYENNNNTNNNEINLLNKKISLLNEENEFYKNKIKELQDQLSNIQKIDNTSYNVDSSQIIIENKRREELELVKKENRNLEININQLNQEIINLNKINEKLKKNYNEEKKKNKDLLENSKPLYTLPHSLNDDIENKLHKKEEELEGFKTFLAKLQKDYEKTKDENEEYNKKINILQKENSSIKKQLERLSITMPKELNALQTQLDVANRKNLLNNKINNIQPKNMTDRDKKKLKDKNRTLDVHEMTLDKYNNMLSKLNDATKEISELKNRNKELRFQLEEKEVKSAYSEFRTEDINISNYEEEFDLKKMANGARDKNRSEDINIDYPGIQGLKDKLVELEFKYNNLVEQVKILIGNISINQKIKPQVTQICQLLGYSPKTTGRIITSNKEKKKILGI